MNDVNDQKPEQSKARTKVFADRAIHLVNRETPEEACTTKGISRRRVLEHLVESLQTPHGPAASLQATEKVRDPQIVEHTARAPPQSIKNRPYQPIKSRVRTQDGTLL